MKNAGVKEMREKKTTQRKLDVRERERDGGNLSLTLCDQTLFIQCVSMGVLNGSVETKTKMYGDIGSWHSEMSDWVNNTKQRWAERKKRVLIFINDTI